MTWRIPILGAVSLAIICGLFTHTLAEQEGFFFEDVTEAVALTEMASSAASWCDFDGDGWVDLYVHGVLYRNLKGETFRIAQRLPGATEGGVWADLENDGDFDLFSWEQGLLFLAQADGRFGAGRSLAPESYASRGAAWGDFDADGLEDLFVGGYEIWDRRISFVDLLFLSHGGKEGLVRPLEEFPFSPARGISVADFDRDLDLDVYVSNYRLQPNRLWRNDGKAGFRDVAAELGVSSGRSGAGGHTIGSAWGDLDNDGWLDLVVGNLSHPGGGQDPPLFLENLGREGNFRFQDRTDDVALGWQESFASPALADFDQDGFLDLLLTAVYRDDRPVLYRNLGDWRFEDVTSESGLGAVPTYQAAWADYDNDGDPDVVLGGRLYRNLRGDQGNWLKVRLEGGEGVSRTALGTQVRVRLEGKELLRHVEGATGEGNQSEPTVHFGLGRTEQEVSVFVHWADGLVSETKSPPNHLLVVTRVPIPVAATAR